MGCNASHAVNPSKGRRRPQSRKKILEFQEQKPNVRFRGDSSIASVHFLGDSNDPFVLQTTDELSKQAFGRQEKVCDLVVPELPLEALTQNAAQDPQESVPKGPDPFRNLHETKQKSQQECTESSFSSPPSEIYQSVPLTTHEIDISSMSGQLQEDISIATNLLHRFDFVSSAGDRKDENGDEKPLSQWTLKPLLQKDPAPASTSGESINISHHQCLIPDQRTPLNGAALSLDTGVVLNETARKARFVLDASEDGAKTAEKSTCSEEVSKVANFQVTSGEATPAGFVESIFCDTKGVQAECRSTTKRLPCPHGNIFICSSCSRETMQPDTKPLTEAEREDAASKDSKKDTSTTLEPCIVEIRDSEGMVAQAPFKTGVGSTPTNTGSHTPRGARIAPLKPAQTDGPSTPATTPAKPCRRDYYLEASPEPCAAPPRRVPGNMDHKPIPPEWLPPSLMPESLDIAAESELDVMLQRPENDSEELLKSLDPGLPSLDLQHRVAELLEERRRNDEIQPVSSTPIESSATKFSQEDRKKADEENADWINFIESRKPIPLGALPSLNEALPPSFASSGNGRRSCPKPPMIAAAEAALAFPWRAGTKSLLYPGCDRVQTMPNFQAAGAKPLKALPPGPLVASSKLAKQSFLPSPQALKACGAEPMQAARAGRPVGSLPSVPFGGPETPTGKIVVGSFAETASANRASSLSALAGIPKHVATNATQSRRVSFDPNM